jgi:hypothetical protein
MCLRCLHACTHLVCACARACVRTCAHLHTTHVKRLVLVGHVSNQLTENHLVFYYIHNPTPHHIISCSRVCFYFEIICVGAGLHLSATHACLLRLLEGRGRLFCLLRLLEGRGRLFCLLVFVRERVRGLVVGGRVFVACMCLISLPLWCTLPLPISLAR